MRNPFRRQPDTAALLRNANDTIEELLNQLDTVTLLAQHNASEARNAEAQLRASRAAHANDLRRMGDLEADYADLCWELAEHKDAVRWWIKRTIAPPVSVN